MLEEETKEVKKGVKEPESPPAPEETVPSPEVKEEPKKAEEVSSKFEEQVKNLNTALKAEREEKRKESELHRQEMEEMKSKLEPIDALRNAFTPKQAPIEEPEAGLSEDKLEEFWAKKESERRQQEDRDNRQNLIKTEVNSLSTEYNGTDGRPKYDDDEVIKWQEDNKKLYLTPSEAFREMKHNELLEYEVGKRLSSTPKAPNAEEPGGVPRERQPKEFKIESESETRAAVLEAMELEEANLDN